MSVRADILLWARRVVALKHAHPYQLLEIDQEANLDDAQSAFHRIAKISHPDLFRSSMTGDELELLTTAYARVAGAYQEFRSRKMQTGKNKALRTQDKSMPPPTSEPAQAGAAGAMTSKALVYYRKAELALRRGDLTGAVLQLKMAIAADPLSNFLRKALSEVEAEVPKKP